MIPFEGKPLIDRTLNNISRIDKLKKIYIVIRADEKDIPSYLGTQYNGIEIEYCIQREDKPGIINAIYSVNDILSLENEDVVINLGDEYYENIDYSDLIRRHRGKNSAVTPVVLYCKDEEEIKKNYSVDITEEGKIIDAVEKPIQVFNNYIGTGIIMIEGEILKDFAFYYRNDLEDKQLVDFMKYAIKKKRECYICKVKTKFCNLNYQKDLEYLYTVSYKEIKESLEERFNKAVSLYEDRIAIRCNNEVITFRELDEKSDLVCYNIKKANLKEGECVAITTVNIIETVIEIIGVLKAGGFYILLDQQYNEEIKKHIINKAGINMIIDNGILRVAESIDNGDSFNRRIDGKAVLLFNDKKEQLSIISKRTVLNLAEVLSELTINKCKKELLEIGMISKISDSYALPFLYASLLNGHTLNILGKDKKDSIKNLILKMNEMDICEVDLKMIYDINECSNENSFIKLNTKVLIYNGKKLTKEVIDKLFKRGIDINSELITFYGKEESGIKNAFFIINKDNIGDLDTIPIGVPISNTRIYILDSNKRIAGVNNVGDIWIAGDGIALQSLKEENFCSDLINKNMKMFKTGDRGYFGADGNVYFKIP